MTIEAEAPRKNRPIVTLQTEIVETIATMDRLAQHAKGNPVLQSIASLLQETRAQTIRTLPEIVIWQSPETKQEEKIVVSPVPPPRQSKQDLQEPVKQQPAQRVKIVPEEDIPIEEKPPIEELEAIDRDSDLAEAIDELDVLKLHERDLRKIPLQIDKHPQWGEEIMVGEIGLLTFTQLSQSNLLTSAQKKEISQVLNKGKFLNTMMGLRIQQVLDRLEKDIYEDGTIRELDVEFMQIIKSSEEVLDQKLSEVRAVEHEKEGEQILQQFIERQLKYIDQGIISFNNLVEGNLRLALWVAFKHQNRGLTIADLTIHAEFGLMEAAAKWDFRRHRRFSTYATSWIRQGIEIGIRKERSMIKLPVHTWEQIAKLRRDDPGKEKQLPEQLARAERAGENPVSLNRTLVEDGIAEFGDTIADPKGAEEMDAPILNDDRQKALYKLLIQLPIRQRMVLKLRFGLYDGRERTLEEVGQEYGISRERVRQIEAKALRKLKHLAGDELRDLL